MLGGTGAGYPADRISRRWTKVIAGTVYVVGAIGCALSVNAGMLIGFRFLFGLAVGTASFVSPLYIAKAALPGAALALGMLSVPQTPRWLVNAGRRDQARRVLTRLRESDPNADVEAKLHDIVAADQREAEPCCAIWAQRPCVRC
jgi:hypothetical protein